MKCLAPTFVVAALALVPGIGSAAPESGASERLPATSAGPLTDGPDQPAPRRRLRFRDGPVCMCTGGMGEEDIRRAEESRRRHEGAQD